MVGALVEHIVGFGRRADCVFQRLLPYPPAAPSGAPRSSPKREKMNIGPRAHAPKGLRPEASAPRLALWAWSFYILEQVGSSAALPPHWGEGSAFPPARRRWRMGKTVYTKLYTGIRRRVLRIIFDRE